MREINAVKKPESFMITRAKNISDESIGGAALIRGRRLYEGGAY